MLKQYKSCWCVLAALAAAALVSGCSRGTTVASAATPTPAAGSKTFSAPATRRVDERKQVAAEARAADTPDASYESAPIATRTAGLTGAIVVEHQVDVAALRDGVIVRLSADVGTPVHKGDLLASMDDREIRAEHDAAQAHVLTQEADLKNWQSEYRVLEADRHRAELMWQSKLITQEQLDHARFQAEADGFQVESQQHKLEDARASLRSLDLELEKTRITAPFDGVVARRYVREGQRVANGDRLFWVSSVAPLLVRFTLPDELAATVGRGDTVSVYSFLARAPAHRARVISVSPVVDPASDSVEVIAKLLRSAGDLKPGMTVNIGMAKTAESR